MPIDKALNRGYVLSALAAPHHRREGLVLCWPSDKGKAVHGPSPGGCRGNNQDDLWAATSPRQWPARPMRPKSPAHHRMRPGNAPCKNARLPMQSRPGRSGTRAPPTDPQLAPLVTGMSPKEWRAARTVRCRGVASALARRRVLHAFCGSLALVAAMAKERSCAARPGSGSSACIAGSAGAHAASDGLLRSC